MLSAPSRQRNNPRGAGSSGQSHVLLLVSAACMFILCGTLVWTYLSQPSDALRVDPSEAAWQRNGVLILPLVTQSHGLRAGDVVIAIDGRSLESWVSGLFHPRAASPHFSDGQRVTYTVLRKNRPLDVSVRLSPYPLGAFLGRNWGMLVFVFVFELIALFVYLRRPAEAAARVLFFSASCLLAASGWLFGVQVIDLTNAAGFWLYSVDVLALYALFWSSLLHFSLVFPAPHHLTVRWRWLIPLVYTLPFLGYGLYLAITGLLAPSTLAWLGLWEPGEVFVGVIYVVLAVVIMTSTYRTHTDPVTRRKIRWVVFASVISGGGAVVLWIIPWDLFGHALINTNMLGLLLLPFPVAIAIAILRYRLFDIDVIINRALVYGTLTATLAAVYFVTVAIFQAGVRALTGQTSTLAIVVATLGTAALIQPLRGRIQTFIDRRFYRGKYDAARTMDAFTATLHTETDLTRLSERLVVAVQETLHPNIVSLWLRSAPAERATFSREPWERAVREASAPLPAANDGNVASPTEASGEPDLYPVAAADVSSVPDEAPADGGGAGVTVGQRVPQDTVMPD